MAAIARMPAFDDDFVAVSLNVVAWPAHNLRVRALVTMFRAAALRALERIVNETRSAGVEVGHQWQRRPGFPSAVEDIACECYFDVIQAVADVIFDPGPVNLFFTNAFGGFNEWLYYDRFCTMLEDRILDVVENQALYCSDCLSISYQYRRRFFVLPRQFASEYAIWFARESLYLLCNRSRPRDDDGAAAGGLAARARWQTFFDFFDVGVRSHIEFRSYCDRFRDAAALSGLQAYHDAVVTMKGGMQRYLDRLGRRPQDQYLHYAKHGFIYHAVFERTQMRNGTVHEDFYFETDIRPRPDRMNILNHLRPRERQFLFAAFYASFLHPAVAETMYDVLDRLLRARLNEGFDTDPLFENWATHRTEIAGATQGTLFGVILILLHRPDLLALPTSAWLELSEMVPSRGPDGAITGYAPEEPADFDGEPRISTIQFRPLSALGRSPPPSVSRSPSSSSSS